MPPQPVHDHGVGASVVVTGDIAVNWTTIRHFCVAVQDANPSHWDPKFADEHWGGIIAPPSMLMVWVAQLPWGPEHEERVPLPLRLRLPGSAIVNISNVAEYFFPLHLGDRVTATVFVESVSGLKHTSLGDGHFITTHGTYTRQDDAVVATERNTLLRYTPTGADP